MSATALCAAALAAACGDSDEQAGPAPDEGAGTEAAAEPAPDSPLGHLALPADTVPGVEFDPVSEQEIGLLAERDPALAEGMTVDPEECLEVARSPITEHTTLEDVSAQIGMHEGHQIGSFVHTDPAYVEGLSALTGDCTEYTITIASPEGEPLEADISNEEFDAAAPDGVEHFTAVVQNSSGTQQGEEMAANSISVSGVVDGTGIQVTVHSFLTEPPQEYLDRAEETFRAQVERVREGS